MTSVDRAADGSVCSIANERTGVDRPYQHGNSRLCRKQVSFTRHFKMRHVASIDSRQLAQVLLEYLAGHVAGQRLNETQLARHFVTR